MFGRIFTVSNYYERRKSTKLIFPKIVYLQMDTKWLAEGTIAAPGSETLDEVNREILEKVPGVAGKFKLVAIIMSTKEELNYPAEFLTSFEISVCTVHIINIKTGSPIACLRKVNPPGLCNGT